MDVVTAVITAERGNRMTSNTEQETAATATAAQPKATKKARVGERARHVAPAKGKTGKKASPAKKATKAAKAPKATKAQSKARSGSKTESVLDLLKRPNGATLQELMKTTSWQAHSVRGFLSGTVRKKLGLDVVSTKGEDGERSYSVKA
jgi:hypothetical protein